MNIETSTRYSEGAIRAAIGGEGSSRRVPSRSLGKKKVREKTKSAGREKKRKSPHRGGAVFRLIAHHLHHNSTHAETRKLEKERPFLSTPRRILSS